MRDVAQYASVSLATVSYIISGRRSGSDRISDETRLRVMTAIDALGYVPNRSAQSLRRQKTDRVCLAVPRLGVPGYDYVAQAILEAASDHGCTFITTITGYPNDVQTILTQMRGGLADGLVLLLETAPQPALSPMLEELASVGVALVVISNAVEPNGFDVVGTDEADASLDAIRLLIAKGHRRIGLIAFDQHGDQVRERYQAYVDGLAEADIPLDRALMMTGAASRQHGYESARRLLTLPDPPTALFVLADIAAISAIHAARDLGLGVPQDVAVIGTGNIIEGEYCVPPLTTVGLVSRDYSEVAGLLFSRLRGDAPPGGRRYIKPWTLHLRGSS
jgi:LacI family transcriptional regulator